MKRRKGLSWFAAIRLRAGALWPVIAGLLAVALVFTMGILGFMWAEGWDFFDSLFMMVITLSTVGYGEVHPLGHDGRIVAMLVILTGVGSFFYLAGALVQLIVEGHIQNIFGRRWMQRSIVRLKGHTIVCGYGRIGAVVAREILNEGQGVVVIEQDQALIDEMVMSGILHVRGDATKDDILLQAGLGRAKSLVTALTKESANVYVTLTARQLNPEIYIVARCDSMEHTQKLERAGANQVLFPHMYGGLRMAQSVLRPSVVNFMDLAMRGDNTDLQMEQLTVAQDSEVAGKNLVDSQIRQRFNVIVIGIVKPGGEMQFNPQPREVLQPGDTLILVGGRQSLTEMQKVLA